MNIFPFRMEVDLLKEETMGAKFASLESLEPLVGNHSIYSHVFDFEQRFDERKAQGWVQENWVPMTAWAGSVYVILVFSGQAWMASRLVHNCTIFLCSLDVRNIDDQCRGPNVKEKDHLVG